MRRIAGARGISGAPVGARATIRAALLVFLGMAPVGAGCGGGDVTRLTGTAGGGEAAPAAEPPSESRTFAVLSERDSLDVVCRFIGVSSVLGVTDGAPQLCSEVVEDCRANVDAAVGGDSAAALGLPGGDLEALFGCPLTLAELDGCVAAALARGVDAYGGSVSCEMPALPEVDPITLFASADCLIVALRCPELLATLAPPQ